MENGTGSSIREFHAVATVATLETAANRYGHSCRRRLDTLLADGLQYLEKLDSLGNDTNGSEF
jgi:hypothetical protein